MSDSFGTAVWGELYLRVRKELEAQHAQLDTAEVDRLVDFRIRQLAENLVALLDREAP